VSAPASIRQSSSTSLWQFSQALQPKLVRRFSWSHGHASPTPLASAVAENGALVALEARARRRELAQLDRNRSGTHKALGVLRFISTKTDDTVDAWSQVQSNFNALAKDGFLHRADFAQCIGPIVRTHSSSLFCFFVFFVFLSFLIFVVAGSGGRAE
jgi:respiratory burst oxidase